MVSFENFLWAHHNPAEVLEEWAMKATEGIMTLSVSCSLDPTGIRLPLSPFVESFVRNAHEFFSTPLSERDENEMIQDFYPGVALTDDELRWVAVHIQNALIPAEL